ncbi:MAG: SusC/RagA family TonB-linked outer membrane protein [Bacteroidales bacterium]|nr:SusC/RagA family TonB-linked outer membrane protein [Bacteroidales bacterium]
MKNRYSIKTIYLWLILILIANPVLSQQKLFTGTVTDDNGNPVSNALVTVKGEPTVKVFTGADGKFAISADPGRILEISTTDNRMKEVQLSSEQMDVTIGEGDDLIPIGFGLQQRRSTLTSSVGFIKGSELSRSSVYNPENALYGRIPGLAVLQNGGASWNNDPDMYIRGVETFGIGGLVNTDILIMIDGFEGRLSSLSMAEIENVAVLKDAAALAMFGLRGANGVLLVNTKRGTGKGLRVDASFEHGITSAFRLPEFLNAGKYAYSVNSARENEGLTPLYLPEELNKFRNGSSPYLYPNVNWLNEGLQDFGRTDVFNVSFQEIANSVRYFGTINFYDEEGLLGPVDINEGYNTQIGNFKINLRFNAEVDLTKSTKLTTRIAGNLGQSSRPATSTSENDVFNILYSTPASVYPVMTYNKVLGGNTSFPSNPVATINSIGYTERGQNELMIDLLVDQDLSFLMKGLSGNVGVSFDNGFQFQDVRSKQYQYEQLVPIVDASGNVTDTTATLYGTDTELAFSTSVPYQWRRFSGIGSLKHNYSWGNSNLSSVVLFQGEQLVIIQQHNTYRHLLAAGRHSFSKADKYFADFAWSFNGTNLLPEGSRWGFFPAISLGWDLAKESILDGAEAVDILKLRASAGLTGNDMVVQNISRSPYISGTGYRYQSNNTSTGGLMEGRLASSPLSFEKSFKTNFGIEALLWESLNINLDAFYNKRTGILVETAGTTSGVMGVMLPYASSGIVTNMGLELGVDLMKSTGDLKYHAGGSLSYVKNEIKEMLEAYQPFDYMSRTGQSISQAFGLEAIGFFRNEAEVNSSPKQTFAVTGPGDIKYKDQNLDNIINEFDEVPIGNSTLNPEIYFAASLGAEYRSFGIEAFFQGIANMTLYLNTPSIFWPLRGNNNISTFSDGAWTPATATTATLPRLTTGENANNFRPNSIWYESASFLKLRSLEIFYRLPQQLISKIKIDDATLYLRGMNLFSVDNVKVVDPEAIGRVYPTLKSFNVGLKIGF